MSYKRGQNWDFTAVLHSWDVIVSQCCPKGTGKANAREGAKNFFFYWPKTTEMLKMANKLSKTNLSASPTCNLSSKKIKIKKGIFVTTPLLIMHLGEVPLGRLRL